MGLQLKASKMQTPPKKKRPCAKFSSFCCQKEKIKHLYLSVAVKRENKATAVQFIVPVYSSLFDFITSIYKNI